MPVDIDTKRTNVIRVKRYKKTIVYDRSRNTHYDYLKNFRIVRYWAQRNHGLSISDLEIILNLYSVGLFTRTEFMESESCFSWERHRLSRLTKEGWIKIFRERSRGEVNLYDLSYKAKMLVTGIYKKLNGEEPIPVSPRRNVIFKKNNTYTDRAFAKAITKFNKEVKERELRPSLELSLEPRRL
jgi:hypothetical protein